MDEVDAHHTTLVPDYVLDVVQVDYLVAHPQQPTHGPPPSCYVEGRGTPKDTPARALLTSRSAARTGCPRPHGPPRRSRTPSASAASPTLRRLSSGRPARGPFVSARPSDSSP